MATDKENTPQRRIEDKHPAEKIDWSQPEAPAVPLSITAGAAKGGNTSDNGSSNVAAPASQAQAAPVDLGHVLRTIRNLLDGSQPKDVPGAIAVIDNALKVGIAWSYNVSPPPGFIAYVRANYAGDVHFHDSEWHAVRLWNAAMKNVGTRLAAPAVIDQLTAAPAEVPSQQGDAK